MTKYLFAWMLFTVLLATVRFANADEIPSNWTSARALGMGNAFTAVATEGDAIFYNPAALARVSGFHWTIMDPRFGLNGLQALDIVKVVSENTDMATKINNLYGKSVWLGAGAKSSFVVPYFGIAAFTNADAGINLQNPAYPQMNINYTFDYGAALGFAFDLVPGIWSFGFTAKRVNRTGTNLPLGPSTLATLNSDTIMNRIRNRGTGYGGDFGTLFTIPGPIRPTLAFTIRNFGYMVFTHEEGLMAPPRSEPDMTLGGSFIIDTPIITITPSVDIRYLDRQDIQTGKKLHLGLEVDLPIVSVRAGLHQGYYSAGFGLDFGVLALDAATYGVELGEYPGQLQDRRYVVQMTLQLGLDGDMFSFSKSGGSGGSGGGGRRLKQRR